MIEKEKALFEKYVDLWHQHFTTYYRIQAREGGELSDFARKKRAYIIICFVLPILTLAILSFWFFGFWGVLIVPILAALFSVLYIELLAKPEIALFDLALSDKARTELRELRDEKKSLQQSLSEQVSRSEQVGSEATLWMQKSSEDQRTIETLQGNLQELNEKIEKAEFSSLEDIPLERLIQHFTAQIEQQDQLDVDTTYVAAMYAMMNSKIPDMKRVRELSAVPNEIFRASQKQAIIEHYSHMITKSEQDESISEEEKADKINSYRLAREQELREEHQ